MENSKIDKPEEKSIFHNKSEAGKGDSPRNISRTYYENYEEINWNNNNKKKTNRKNI